MTHRFIRKRSFNKHIREDMLKPIIIQEEKVEEVIKPIDVEKKEISKKKKKKNNVVKNTLNDE